MFSKINNKTLFILGAGASVFFGLPTGAQLVKNITKGNYEIAGITGTDLEEFKKKLKNTGLKSIDLFLEYAYKNYSKEDSEKYIGIGKEVILYFMRIGEKQFNYNEIVEKVNDNWYLELWDRIHDKQYKLRDGSITFITFNYEFSLEIFLYKVIRHTNYSNKLEKEDKEKIIDLIKKIKIIHIYGTVGDIILNTDVQIFSPDFSIDSDNLMGIKYDKDRIKLIHERNDADSDIKEAKKIVEEAGNIYILGFGYDDINMKKLGFEINPLERLVKNIKNRKINSKSIYATRYKINDRKVLDKEEKTDK